MTQKNNQPHLFMGGIEGSDLLCGGMADANIAGGVTLKSDTAHAPRKVVLQLTNAVITHTEALDYSSLKLCDMPDSNILYLAAEVDLECVKGLTTNGLVATTDITLALGSAAASNSTLSSTMQDILELDALTPTDASPAWQAHSMDQVTIPLPYEVADAATNAVYLNLAAATTADDTLTVTGTVTLIYIDLGNVTS